MKKYAIGVDLGGTYTKLALVDKNGRVHCRAKLPTTAYKTKEALLTAIVAEIGAILKENRLSFRDLAGVGIGVPGLVAFEEGLVYSLTNVPGWKNVRLKKILETRLRKIPVLVDNDVNLMTLGESRFGAGRGAKNLVCITLGTGVGGGIIIDGNLYRGTSSAAGEVGHMPLKEEGLRCNCGSFGCLERYVGNRYIVDEIKDKIRSGRPTKIRELVRGNLSLVTPEIISKAAKKKDALAIECWRRVGKRIGVTLSGVINLLNPEKIIIGGGMADAGEVLFKAIRDTVNERALPVSKGAVKIVKAKLGNDAGLAGAAALFMPK
ncbi:MAG: ROK family glucokinase [Candidatus Omnitrophota bacterium]|nr:ROK family glucokinase [Candidatus Omnitrophota bacterium]